MPEQVLEIRAIWSDVITPSEIEDFRYVVNTVFGPFCTMEYFRRKYIDNIYGPSLIYIVYSDGKPVGSFALWRNDIGGVKAYTSAETSVLPSCHVPGAFGAIIRAKSIFAKENDAVVFAFPNKNSFLGVERMGWNGMSNGFTDILFSLSSTRCPASTRTLHYGG